VSSAPRLLIAAHGTTSAAGSAMTAELAAQVAAARADVTVSLCFLDVVEPLLATALDECAGEPVVVLPLLLSAGYHMHTDIPAVIAGRRNVCVARHLGPDPLVVDVVAERLAAARGMIRPATTVLAGIGSSRESARAEVDVAAEALASRVGRPVSVLALFGDVRAALAALAFPVEVGVYLLADGEFLDGLRVAAAGLPVVVAEPIGVHPALVSLVLARYDEAVGRPDPAGAAPPTGRTTTRLNHLPAGCVVSSNTVRGGSDACST
jgi:sirohydrochlorin ferrochelatase